MSSLVYYVLVILNLSVKAKPVSFYRSLNGNQMEKGQRITLSFFLIFELLSNSFLNYIPTW